MKRKTQAIPKSPRTINPRWVSTHDRLPGAGEADDFGQVWVLPFGEHSLPGPLRFSLVNRHTVRAWWPLPNAERMEA